MDWTIIEKITNHPVFIALVTIAPLAGLVLGVLSRTSVGKKAILKMTSLVSGVDSKIKDTHKLVDDTLDTVNDIKEEFNDVKKELKDEVKTYFAQLEYFEKGIFDVIALIPNAKVQEKAKEFLSKWSEKKKEIKEFVGNSYTEVETKLKEVEEEKTREIDALKGEISKLEELVKECLKVKENVENGERNEGINNQAEEE